MGQNKKSMFGALNASKCLPTTGRTDCNAGDSPPLPDVVRKVVQEIFERWQQDKDNFDMLDMIDIPEPISEAVAGTHEVAASQYFEPFPVRKGLTPGPSLASDDFASSPRKRRKVVHAITSSDDDSEVEFVEPKTSMLSSPTLIGSSVQGSPIISRKGKAKELRSSLELLIERLVTLQEELTPKGWERHASRPSAEKLLDELL
ncbi:hypothetical protein EV361DRAFT_956864 [Lentinula raphanica]|nr:hypothetical protein EV361DRAFT_956864 [Lentinula raphanica]